VARSSSFAVLAELRGIHMLVQPWSGGARCYQVIDRLLKNLEKRLGIQTDPERHDEQRHKGQHLARRQVVQLFVLRIVTVPKNTRW
jgi:hypothetical protein